MTFNFEKVRGNIEKVASEPEIPLYCPKLTQGQFEEYIRESKEYDYLQSKVDLQDIRIFPTINHLRDFFLGIIPANILDDIVEHELSYGRMAESLGHPVQYGTFLMKSHNGDLVAVPFTHVVGESSSIDFNIISNAPPKPSIYDRV